MCRKAGSVRAVESESCHVDECERARWNKAVWKTEQLGGLQTGVEQSQVLGEVTWFGVFGHDL